MFFPSIKIVPIPVPPGCTITTEVCTFFNENGKTYPQELDGQLKKALKDVEDRVGAVFGDSENPLLLSVRYGNCSKCMIE